MAWIEWLKVLGLIVSVVGALLTPFIYIWKKSEKEKDNRDRKLEDLVNKSHKHEVDIAGLKQGKVGHEQMQEAIQRMESSTQHKFEAMHNKIDLNHRDRKSVV